jgi:hypothetical protein
MKNSLSSAILIAIFLMGLSGCTRLSFEVAARTDPYAKPPIGPSTYAFKSDTLNRDPVIERNLQYLIDITLSRKGWKKTAPEDAKYVFSVESNMDTKQETSSHRVGDYDYNTRTWSNVTQEMETDTYYARSVKIFCFTSKGGNGAIWSADCTSTGSTQDILYAAKQMIPYAMNRFPQIGLWKETVHPD